MKISPDKKITLCYDGDVLDDADTIQGLDIEDGDLLDVQVGE